MILLEAYTTLEDKTTGFSVLVGPKGLALKRGQIAALWGTTGSGKSVFLDCILNYLNSKKAFDVLKRKRQLAVQYIPQHDFLFMDCTLRLNAALRAGLFSRQRVFAVMPSEVSQHVASSWTYSPGSLSGGQRLSLALSSALAGSGEILLLDETLASMDSKLRDSYLLILREQLKDGKLGCVIIATHDPHVRSQCDVLWKIESKGGNREVISQQNSDLLRPNLLRTKQSETTTEPNAVPGSNFKLFSDLVVASIIAALVTLLLLYWAASSSGPGGDYFIPKPLDFYNALRQDSMDIAWQIGYAWFQALVASLLAVLGAFAAVVFAVPLQVSIGRLFVLTLIALQAIPLLVLANTLQLQLGLKPAIAQVLISASFLFFPLAVAWIRLAKAAPQAILRVRGVKRFPTRAVLAVLWSSGAMARVFIACSPLVAIGVVVSGYVASQFGLGYKLAHVFSYGAPIARRWIYTIACVNLGCLVLATSAVVCRVIFPKDVDYL